MLKEIKYTKLSCGKYQHFSLMAFDLFLFDLSET